MQDRTSIRTDTFKGEFLKPCPGTTAGYLCCDYQIITPARGCGMYCRYCVLQTYFDDHRQVVYTNMDDCKAELEKKMALKSGVVRFGTGEFADSLFLEDQYPVARTIAAMLKPYNNAVVEFKTKSVTIKNLGEIEDPSKVIIGFSINTPAMIATLEKNTAPLLDRIHAAQKCCDMGFHIAFHNDPIVWYPEWKVDYELLIDTIFSIIKTPKKIAWWSMGGFRTTPDLKRRLMSTNNHLPLFCGEMIMGQDGKLRYFSPIRTDFYKTIQNRVQTYFPNAPLYLCMESEEVWKASGMINQIPNGLPHFLDTRAQEILSGSVNNTLKHTNTKETL